jgi:hypothetical protein
MLNRGKSAYSDHLSQWERSAHEVRRVRGYGLSRVLSPLTPTLIRASLWSGSRKRRSFTVTLRRSARSAEPRRATAREGAASPWAVHPSRLPWLAPGSHLRMTVIGWFSLPNLARMTPTLSPEGRLRPSSTGYGGEGAGRVCRLRCFKFTETCSSRNWECMDAISRIRKES